jgi:hypothetical protein
MPIIHYITLVKQRLRRGPIKVVKVADFYVMTSCTRTKKGFVRANAPSANDVALGQGDAPPPQTPEPVPLLQLITRDDPAGRDDVRALPDVAGEVRRQRVSRMRGFRQWRWHLDEVYVKILVCAEEQ